MAVTRATDSDLATSVGLTDADLVAMYHKIALARAVDERMWILNRAGRIPFVISGQGHEGAQVGIAWPLERKKDWIAPFYRSIATCLAFGMTAQDILMAQYAKASDPSSGGRQMPGHYGNAENNLVSLSSPVATQMLHAVGIALAAKIRKTGQVAMTSMGEGSSNQGDVTRASTSRPSTSSRSSSSSRTTAMRSACRRPWSWPPPTSPTGPPATGSPASWSTDPTSWPATERRKKRSTEPGAATARPSSRPR